MSVIYELAERLGQLLLNRKLRCAVAESCTGGGLAAAITDVAGSSQWFDRGFVTYTNEAKEEVLAVAASVITREGAVSEATVRAMAHGTLAGSRADVSVAISGIAGPGGGTTKKPVGTVWIAWAGNLQPTYAQCYFFVGDRAAIRQQSIQAALEGLIHRCESQLSPPNSARYFFALWPDNKTAQALYQRGRETDELNQGKTVLAKDLHVTLTYLGALPPDVVHAVKQIASQLRVAPFELCLSTVNYWPHIHLRWLGFESTPPELTQLVNLLKNDLIAAGCKPEKSSYIPHVTIARKCTHPYLPAAVESLSWFVKEFCLVKSSGSTEGSKYEVVQRWALY